MDRGTARPEAFAAGSNSPARRSSARRPRCGVNPAGGTERLKRRIARPRGLRRDVGREAEGRESKGYRMEAPTTRERNILGQLHRTEWENAASVCPGKFGEKSRSEMLAKGWIEFEYSPSRILRVRKTQLGAEALRMPMLPKLARRPKLTTLKPMLREAKIGIGEAKSRKSRP